MKQAKTEEGPLEEAKGPIKKLLSICPHKALHGMCTEALFITARVETNKWLFTGEQINKALYIHRTEYSSVIKRNEVPVKATTCTNPNS